MEALATSPGPVLSSQADIVKLMGEAMATLDREHFIVLHLDVRNRVISQEIISIGTLTTALVHPREVFKGAILANAAAIIGLHNHPSGDPDPSAPDLELTRRLRDAGELLGMPLHDHLVIAGGGGWRSVVEWM